MIIVRGRRPPTLPHHSRTSSLVSSLPPQRLCTELVHLYLRTFETVFRILHVPTFRAQYTSFQAESPELASPVFVAQQLLICAFGTCFYARSDIPRYTMRASALRWIAETQAWMGSPSEKSRLNFTGLQTQCLLLLAKQAYPGGPELVWISAGSLVRAAMQLGLHHSPSKLPGVGTFDGEMRKRLWATILDLQIQSSIESGGPPLISENDYDCELPSNVDDAQIKPGINGPIGLLAKPLTTFTATSIKCALARTSSTRLEIAKYLNDFSSRQTYDETLRLSNKPKFLLDDNMRLFRYYFSHKFCLDLSLSILRSSTTAPTNKLTGTGTAGESPPEDDYGRLQVLGSGLFRDSPLRSVIFVCIELLLQLEDDNGQIGSTFNSLGRQELYKTVTEYVQLLAKRIEAGETTVRGHVFFSSLLAHMDALQASRPSKEAILAAMKSSLEFCQSMLKTMAQAYSATSTNSASNGVSVSNLDDLRYLTVGGGGSTTPCSTETGLVDSNFLFDLDVGTCFDDGEENFLHF